MKYCLPQRTRPGVLAALLSLNLGLACSKPAEPKPTPPPPAEPAAPPKTGATDPKVAAVDPLDPNSCKSCHGAVYEEWSDSIHAHSHQTTDPVFNGMRELRRKKQGEHILGACAACHYPRAKDFDGPVAKAGLGCTSCHSVKALHPGPKKFGGRAAEYYADNTLVGPHDTQDNPAHKGGPAPAHMKDGSSLCLSCHGALKNPVGLPACNTGPEWIEFSKDSAGQTCVSCHMAETPGPSGTASERKKHANHRFHGPRMAWDNPKQRLAIPAVSLELAAKGKQLTATLTNLTGHSYPTGFPGRMVILKLVGLNAAGKPIWTNFKTNPMKESRQSVLNKVYLGKDKKPTMPPFAVTLKSDTRLKPKEQRALRYKLPSKVKTVKAKLLYRLGPPPIAKPLGLVGSPLMGVHPIATAKLTR